MLQKVLGSIFKGAGLMVEVFLVFLCGGGDCMEEWVWGVKKRGGGGEVVVDTCVSDVQA